MNLLKRFSKFKDCIEIINICRKNIHYSFGQYSRKLEWTPYPWKNHDYQDPKFQYNSKILDNDLSNENKEGLLDERLALCEVMNESRHQILNMSTWPRNEYIPHKTQRCGLIGYKLGTLPHWCKTGKRISTTLYQVIDNVALNYIPPNEVENLFKTERYYMRFKDDYPKWVTQHRWGLQFVGAIAADPSEFTPKYAGLYTKFGVTPRRKLARFLVSDDAAIEPGRELSVQHFRIGDYIDLTARTCNYGFEGVMVRHGFKGGPAANGSTKFHRRPGSIGHGMKVLRGQRMPGVMGNRLKTVRGLQIVRMDYKYNILYIGGVTPGPIHSFAHLSDTWLKYRIDEMVKVPSMPTIYEKDEEWVDWTQHPDDDFVERIHKFDDPSILYNEDVIK